MNQISLFDSAVFSTEMVPSIPQANEEGLIPAALLVPEKWEAWKFSNSNWTLQGGEPYVIEAVVALLPGNRLYVKEWMMYPFMYEYESYLIAQKKYLEHRNKITEYMKRNDEHRRTWALEELPALSDMWKYADGEYSCFEYADKAIHGYMMQKTGTEE